MAYNRRQWLKLSSLLLVGTGLVPAMGLLAENGREVSQEKEKALTHPGTGQGLQELSPQAINALTIIWMKIVACRP